MKTRLYQLLALGMTISSLAFCTGCKGENTEKMVPVAISPAPATVIGPAELSGPAAITPQEPPVAIVAAPAEAVPAPMPPVALPVPADAAPVLEAPPAPSPIAPENVTAQMVQPAVPLDATTNSAALAQVVRLVQSGVGEDIVLTYIKNSAEPFNVGSEQIIYLNDLGVSGPVMTALIQHDGSLPKRGTVAPLPPGVALNTPAPNIYSTSPAAPVPAGQVPGAMPPGYEQTAPATAVAPAPGPTPEPPPVVAEQPPVSVNYFYNYLTPYGNWVNVDGYGLCWQPTVSVVNTGWRPYGDSGRWVYTVNGWYWYSEYSWGWAPFHYGRWCNRPRVGWFWVPDTTWGPAWVSWRYSSDYCGWAPLPPEVTWVGGVGLCYRGRGFSVGFDFGLLDFCYTYIPTRHFCDPHPHAFFVARRDVPGIHAHTTVINNYVVNKTTVVNHGISVTHIRNVAGTVPTAAIQNRPLPGRPEGRIESLKTRGNTLVVEHPTLPKTPPPAPKLTATVQPSAGRPAPQPGAVTHVVPTKSAPARVEKAPVSAAAAPKASASFAPGNAASLPVAGPAAPGPRTISPSTGTMKPAATPIVRPEPAKTVSAPITAAKATPTPAPQPSLSTLTTTRPSGVAPNPSPNPSREVYRSPGDVGRSHTTVPAVKTTAPSVNWPAPRSVAPVTSSAPSPSPRSESRSTYSAPAPSVSSPAPSRTPSYSAPATRSAPSSGGGGRSGNGKNDR